MFARIRTIDGLLLLQPYIDGEKGGEHPCNSQPSSVVVLAGVQRTLTPNANTTKLFRWKNNPELIREKSAAGRRSPAREVGGAAQAVGQADQGVGGNAQGVVETAPP